MYSFWFPRSELHKDRDFVPFSAVSVHITQSPVPKGAADVVRAPARTRGNRWLVLEVSEQAPSEVCELRQNSSEPSVRGNQSW